MTKNIYEVIKIENDKLPEKYIVLTIETTGLLPWYEDRITCICAKDSDDNKFEMVDEDETKIILEFFQWIDKRAVKDYFLITRNGKQFTIPFIITRGMNLLDPFLDDINGINPLDYNNLDLQELTKNRIHLADMAKLLCCTPKSGNKINAIKLWEEDRYDELKEYCMQDVETTEDVYLQWKMLQELKDHKDILIKSLEDYREWFSKESENKMEDEDEKIDKIDEALKFIRNVR